MQWVLGWIIAGQQINGVDVFFVKYDVLVCPMPIT